MASFDGKPQSPCGRFAGWGSCCFSEQERCGGSGSVDVKRVAIRRPSRQLSAKPRRSDRAAASGVRKRDVLTGARSQGRSAVERVTEAVTGAGIMFRPFKSLGVVDFPGMRHHPIPCHAASSRCRSPPGRPLGYGGGSGRTGRRGLVGADATVSRGRHCRSDAPTAIGVASRALSGQHAGHCRSSRCQGGVPAAVGATRRPQNGKEMAKKMAILYRTRVREVLRRPLPGYFGKSWRVFRSYFTVLTLFKFPVSPSRSISVKYQKESRDLLPPGIALATRPSPIPAAGARECWERRDSGGEGAATRRAKHARPQTTSERSPRVAE